jgi:hypothetical protein
LLYLRIKTRRHRRDYSWSSWFRGRFSLAFGTGVELEDELTPRVHDRLRSRGHRRLEEVARVGRVAKLRLGRLGCHGHRRSPNLKAWGSWGWGGRGALAGRCNDGRRHHLVIIYTVTGHEVIQTTKLARRRAAYGAGNTRAVVEASGKHDGRARGERARHPRLGIP